MKSYYECHITMLGDPKDIRPLVEKLKWKFSSINGDPVLGDGNKCYATMLYNDKMGSDQVLTLLKFNAGQLKRKGIKVIRRKIEKVIWDDRSKEINWDCPCVDCHIDDLT